MKYKLSQLFTIIGGGTPKTSKSEYWGGSIPWLSVKDFNNDNRYVYTSEKTITDEGLANSTTTLLQKNDIIISARGTVGEMASIPFPMAFNQSCYGLRANKGIVDADFLYYLVKLKVVELRHNSHGSVFDTITRDTFDGIEVDIPSMSIQKKIGRLLSQLDEKIELNSAINNNLQQQAQVLFKSFFVDYSKNANEETYSTYLGEVPNSFAVKKLGDLPLLITDYVANGSFASLKENVSLLPIPDYAYFIRNTDLKSGNFGVFVNRHSYDFLSKSALYGNEIIISNVGDVGSVFLCPILDKPMTLGNNVIMVRPKDEILNYYLYMWFKWFSGQGLIQGIKGGSAQPKFNKTDFRNLPTLIPPDELLYEFHQLVSPMFKKINDNNCENKSLSTLRDSLLPKLMSGEIDMSDVEI